MRRLGILLIVAVCCLPGAAVGQLTLPGLESETVLPLTQNPADVIRANLEARQQEYDDRLDRRQSEFRWQLERLERRRNDLADRAQTWRQRRAELGRTGPARREVLSHLLERAEEMDELLRETEESYDAQIQGLIEASAAARQLQLDVDATPGWLEDGLSTAAIDARIEDLEVEIALRRARLLDLQEHRTLLEDAGQEHRETLDEVRLAMLDEELSARFTSVDAGSPSDSS